MSPLATAPRDLHRLARAGAEVGVGLVAHGDLVLLGDAEEHADDPHRELGGQLGDDVEAVGADERVEAADAVVADLVLERGHPPGREHPGQEAAVHGVHRRVLEHDHARRERHPALMTSRMSLRVLVKVCQLRSAFSTSAWRDRAQKS